jgi:hypothetical protein
LYYWKKKERKKPLRKKKPLRRKKAPKKEKSAGSIKPFPTLIKEKEPL